MNNEIKEHITAEEGIKFYTYICHECKKQFSGISHSQLAFNIGVHNSTKHMEDKKNEQE